MTDEKEGDRQAEPERRYAVDHSSSHETRHEAIGTTAIINGSRNRIAPERGSRATVHAYEVCGCEQPQAMLHTQQICERCGGTI